MPDPLNNNSPNIDIGFGQLPPTNTEDSKSEQVARELIEHVAIKIFENLSLSETNPLKATEERDRTLLNQFPLGNASDQEQFINGYASQDLDLLLGNLGSLPFVDLSTFIKAVDICAGKDLLKTADQIKKMGITDENLLAQIAKNLWINLELSCYELNHSSKIEKMTAVMKLICTFDIKDEAIWVMIFKLCLDLDLDMTQIFIENKKFQSEILRVELATLMAEESPALLSKYIKEFQIKSENIRFELAKVCAKDSSFILSSCIGNFEINDEKKLLELAMLCAESDKGESAYLFIDNFGIKDQDKLFELAKLYARHSNFLPLGLYSFGDLTKEQFAELARIIACAPKSELPKYIYLFEITDQNLLLEILKLCLEKNPSSTFIKIRKFDLKDYDLIVELIFWVFDKYPENVKHLLQAYRWKIEHTKPEHKQKISQIYQDSFNRLLVECNIDRTIDSNTTEDEKFEIVNSLIGKGNRVKVAQFFPIFRIKDDEKVLEIAKLCLENDERDSSFKYFWNFKFRHPTSFIKLANLVPVLLTKKDFLHLISLILVDRSKIFELLEKNMPRIAIQFSRSLQLFTDLGKIELTRLVKLAFEHGGFIEKDTFGYIEPLDRQTRLEIVKIAAKGNPESLALHLHCVGIQDQEDRIEIVKILVNLIPREAGNIVKNSSIEDPRIREEIAWMAVELCGGYIIAQLDKFDLDQKVQAALINKALDNLEDDFDPEWIYNKLNDLELNEYLRPLHIKLFSLFPELFTHFIDKAFKDPQEINLFLLFLIDLNIDKVLPQIQAISEDAGKILTESFQKFKMIREKSSETAIQEALFGLSNKIKFAVLMCTYDVIVINHPLKNRFLDDSGLMELILNFWQPDKRQPLFLSLLPFAQLSLEERQLINQKLSEVQNLISTNKHETKRYSVELSKGLILKGISLELIEEFLKRAFRSVNGYKDGRVGAVLIEFFIYLNRNKNLSIEDMNFIFKKILNAKSAQSSKPEAPLIEDVRSFLTLEKFGRISLALSPRPLDECVQEAFQEMIPIAEVERLTEKLEKHFFATRNPTAILQYAAAIKSLNDQKAMDCLVTYVSSVLNGTFKNVRYDLTRSTHLQKINENHPHIFQEWQKNISYEFDLNSLQEDSKKEVSLNLDTWLRQKIEEGHLPLEKFEHLQKYVAAPSIASKLIEDLERATKMRGSDKNPDSPMNRMKFEMLCLKLTCCDPSKKNSLLKTLDKMVPKLHLRECQFAQDIKDLLITTKTQNRGSKIKVYVSDDPIDLLLAGTDVTGSCQRVDGTPSLNKGLLGYLMNGWNQILKVADEPTGPILARAILRLKWDGEQPVLFMERIYPFEPSGPVRSALMKAAFQRAKELGIPLLSMEGNKDYGKSIEVLGGIAPYEYSDAAKGVKEGAYNIETPKLLS